MAARDQALGQRRGDLLPGTVRARGHAVSDRGENSDPDGGLLKCPGFGAVPVYRFPVVVTRSC